MREVDFSGAVASNAGDDFHVLWAAREMLRLLDTERGVLAVKVEGLPNDEIHAQLGEHGQAADVTLTCTGADGPVYRYLQLKHSASNPENSWTWSRLLAPRTPRKPQSSVLGKLAGLVKGVSFNGDFSIVTNQPLMSKVADDVTRLIANNRNQAPEDAELVGTLMKSLGLNKRQLLIFLKSWDLSGFSSSSRLRLETELLQHLASMYDADARDDLTHLQRRVTTLMLPEGRMAPPVDREQLAIWLGIGNERMLYPASSQIRRASPYLRRRVMDELGDKLSAPQNRPLRIHAGGGCGKTSLLCDLHSALPNGSELFIYDCYGGGYFLASDQKRHLPEQAFAQIANELAARFRTPLLVRQQGSNNIFEAFRNRVVIASRLLSGRNPDALLVLCFDAVDNARKGALLWHEPCFLDLLSQASGWPDNVRIVVSCRTARLDEVGARGLYQDFEVKPFKKNEVASLVALWQPTWPSRLASTFWDLTGGVPRRIVYAIEGLPPDGAARAIERLMPKATGIDPLFEHLVAEAGKHLGDAGKVWIVLDALARLPRPVPGQILATLAGMAPLEIRDIAADVGGILEREDGWSFHDEDFEAFVVERPGDEGAALLARAADLLLETRLTDRYAASAVAEVLVAAGRLDALYELVTKNEPPSVALSPLEQQFVWSRRLGLAIRCCREVSDIATACSLLITSAEAIGRTRLLEELTVDNLDLAVRFAADEANRLVMVGQRRRRSRPRLRIELARHAALTHPVIARAHLRWWHAYLGELRNPDPRDKYQIGAQDIAAEYAAHAALDGEENAFDRLFRWRPLSALLQVLPILAAHAAGRNADALRRAIVARAWPPIVLAPLMAAALLSGSDIDEAQMRGALHQLASVSRARWPKSVETGFEHASILSWHEAVLLVAECALVHHDLHPLIDQLIAQILPRPELEEDHQLYRLRSSGASYARAHALRERITGVVVKVADWLPPARTVPPRPTVRQPWRGRSETSPEERWNELLSETTTVYARLVDAARATLDGMLSDPVAAWPAVAKTLTISRTWEERSRRDPDTAFLLMRNHLVHSALRRVNVGNIIPQIRKVLASWSADSIRRAQDLAETLALVPHAHDTSLALLTTLANEIEREPLPARDRVKLLTKNARIALPLDPNLARWLFGLAVDATAAVDFEASSALGAAGAIAATGLSGTHEETARLAARLGDAAGAIVETLGLGGDFAWHKTAAWVAAANLPTGLAAVARWHDSGVEAIDRTLPGVLERAQGFTLAQRSALALLATDAGLNVELAAGCESSLPGWFTGFALEQLQRKGEIEALIRGLDLLQRRATPDALIDLASQRPVVDRLEKAMRDGEQDMGCDGSDGPGVAAVIPAEEQIHKVADIRTALSPQTERGGTRAYQFSDVARRIGSRALRIPFLEVAIEVAGTDGAFGEAIPEILGLWSDYPPAVDWIRHHLPGYIASSLSGLFQWTYEDTHTLEAALAATGLPPHRQAEILLDGIERKGERISAEMLYALTGLIAARAPESQRAHLFDALLQRVETHASHPAQVLLVGPIAPEGTSKSVASALFAAMGDADRSVRWRAAHAGLALARGGDPAWDELTQCLGSGGADVFKGAPFYRYGALEQLMITIQRAALEYPGAVAPYTELILETIRREPHVIVRELGRWILQRLDAVGAAPLDPPQRAFVEYLNRSQLPPVERKDRFQVHREGGENERKRNYDFDTMDAVPYWFSPVVRIFDIPMSAFLDRLEHWLHDKWGYVETTTHWLQEPRLARFEHARGEMSRSHGTQPVVERLNYHIEWHAMMCAVGEMIADVPLLKTEGPEYDGLEAWIYENMPAVGPNWLSDLRTAPPFEPRFWGKPPAPPPPQLGTNLEERAAASRAWYRSITPDLLDVELLASEGIIVAADFKLRWHTAIHRAHIQSALVSPETAMALARALTTIQDRMDFALPDAWYHDDIKVPGFELEAWLQTPDRDPRADKVDARRGSISGIPVRPVGALSAEQLTFDVTRSSWRSREGDAAISIDQWGSEEASNGNGWRAIADRRFLLDLLRRTDRSLLLNVEISRQIQDDDIERNPRRWSLYVLDAAGNLTPTERYRRDLGRYLVRREGLSRSVDTLGRWMLHRAAELDRARESANSAARDDLQKKVDAVCRAFRERPRY